MHACLSCNCRNTALVILRDDFTCYSLSTILGTHHPTLGSIPNPYLHAGRKYYLWLFFCLIVRGHTQVWQLKTGLHVNLAFVGHIYPSLIVWRSCGDNDFRNNTSTAVTPISSKYHNRPALTRVIIADIGQCLIENSQSIYVG